LARDRPQLGGFQEAQKPAAIHATLSAIAAADTGPFRLVFAVGMSEDIDLKNVFWEHGMHKNGHIFAGVVALLTLSESNAASAGSPSACNPALVISTYNKIDASKSDWRMANFVDQETYGKIKQSAGLSATIYGIPVGADYNQFKENISNYKTSNTQSFSEEQFQNVAWTGLGTEAADAYKECIRSKSRGLYIIPDKSSDADLSFRISYGVIGGSPNPLPVIWSGGAAKDAALPKNVSAGERIIVIDRPTKSSTLAINDDGNAGFSDSVILAPLPSPIPADQKFANKCIITQTENPGPVTRGHSFSWICDRLRVINAMLYDKLNFNFLRDIAPVAADIRTPFVMVLNLSFPATSVPEFIAYAKGNPGKINVASAGNGTPSHVAAELFKMMAGVDMVHVPYRGEASELTDLLGGQVQVCFGTVLGSIEYIRAGGLRGLAVTTTTRSEALPDLPTVGEFLPGFEASGWAGIGAPKGTPTAIIDKLNKEINAGLADPKMKERIANLGATVLVNSPADFGKLIADETERWGKVIRAANIRAQ
jgi:tripartite-type tricarboxylate transporter receptor subunit TctC